jgi:hypothetical protein
LEYEKDDEWKMYMRRMMRNGWYKKKFFMDARPDQQVKEKLNSRPMIYSYPNIFILVWGCGHQYRST